MVFPRGHLTNSFGLLVSCFWGLILVHSVLAGEAIHTERLQEAIVLDGRLEETAWQEGQQHSLRYSLSNQAPTVETWFKVRWDNEACYFGFYCEQPDMAAIKAKVAHHDGNVWDDDCVELFLDPSGNGESFYQFVINSRGTIFDAHLAGVGNDNFWDGVNIQAAGYSGPDYWSVEFRLPWANILGFADIGQRVSADSWRMNVAREYYGGVPRLLTYSALSNYFDYTNYSPFTGIELNYRDKQWGLGPISQAQSAGADASAVGITIETWNATSDDETVMLLGTIKQPDGSSQDFSFRDVALAAGEKNKQHLEIKADDQEAVELTAQLMSKDGQALLACGRYTVPIHRNPLKVQITHPYYRSAIYATMDINEIEVAVSSHWAFATDPADRLVLELRDAENHAVCHQEADRSSDYFGKHRLAIPTLAPGDYRCVVQWLRDGKPLYDASTVLHVYGPSASEVRVNEYLNFVMNGEEFFPIGTFNSPWGSSIASSCNTSINYCTAYDLVNNLNTAEGLSAMAAANHYMAMFPHTKELWSHLVDGHPELALRPLPAADAQTIGQRVAQYQQQPGIWAWYMADEPSPYLFLPDYLIALGHTVRQYDPYHPAYISYNRGTYAKVYAEATDALGVHWYPGFTDRGMVFPMSTIADEMEAAKAAVDNRQAIIFSPQMILLGSMGDQDIRPITHQESRCMVYQSIVHGAKGIIWFANYGLQSSMEIRIGMPYLAQELRALDFIFLAHETAAVNVSGADAASVHCLAKVIDGQLYVIAVNAANRAVQAQLSLPVSWSSIDSIQEIAADQSRHTLKNAGRLDLGLSTYEVRIFTTAPKYPDLPSREHVARLFTQQHERFMAAENFCYSGSGALLELSPNYGVLGMARMAIDGYTDYAGEMVTGALKDSWLRVTIPAMQTIGSIEVFSGRDDKRGPLRSYHLEIMTEDQTWQPVSGDVQEEQDGDQLRRIHTITPVKVGAIRLVLDADMAKAGYLYEIQAFAPKDSE